VQVGQHDGKGLNTCNGKGFLVMTKDEYDKIQGATFEAEMKG